MADCIFCKLAKGEVPSFKVYEDDTVIASLDINPGTKGQVIVITKKHVKGIHELTPSEAGKVFQAIRLIIIGLTQSMNCEGVNVVYSLGAIAGQRTDHMLVYVIPRYKDDKVVVYWEPKQGNPNELKQTANKVSEAIKSIPKIVSSTKPKVIEEKETINEEVIEEKPRIPYY